MGHIYYGRVSDPIPIEDRTLAHLKIVIVTKLRRNESLMLSWPAGAGRETLWLHPSIPLRFVFDEPTAPELSAEQVRSLAAAAATNGGIALGPEDLAGARPAGRPAVAPTAERRSVRGRRPARG